MTMKIAPTSEKVQTPARPGASSGDIDRPLFELQKIAAPLVPETEFNPLVSYFPNAYENLPTDIPAAQFIASIKGGQHKKLVEEIRERFQRALARGVDYAKAKRAVDTHKKKLPCVSFAGILPMRDKNATPQFTGLFQADLDLLGDRLSEIRGTLMADPHVYAQYVSPTGEGLKAIYRVPICRSADEYKLVFAAVSARVQDLAGVEIDKLENFTCLCFASHDPDAYLNPNAVELPVGFSQPAEMNPPLPTPKTFGRNYTESRRAVAERVLGAVEWHTYVLGDCHCPGEAQHTAGEKPHECQIHLDGPPTIHCLHKSCEAAVAEVNSRLRSEIGKAERPAIPKSNRAGIAGEYLGPEPEPEQADLPPIIDAADFLAQSLPIPPELVAGILHQGSKLALGGSSKAFKTWILLELGVAVATGTDWLGHHTTQGKGLYVNFEIQPAPMQRRIAAVARAKGVELKLGALQFWNLRGHAAGFRTLIPKIIERCRAENFALIILDPIYKLYGGTDENAAGDVAELLNSLERLTVETGAAVAYGCHFAKGNAAGKEAQDRISGSGVFARDPDSLLIFTKHEEPDAFTVEPILRNFAPVEPFVVRWQFPLMETDEALDPADLKQPAGRKREHDPVKLLAVIANNDAANPISTSKWARLAEIPRKTLTDYLAEMRHKNWIKTIGEGSHAKQAITNEGKAILNK